MFKKLAPLSLFCILFYSAKAGDPDTNYVQKFRNIFAIKGFVLANGFNYALTPRNNTKFTEAQLKDAKVIYSPYIPTTVAASINIKGFGFTYVFKLKDDFLDTLGKAKSDYKRFMMNMYGNKFGFEGYYQDYRRFYYHYKGDERLLKNYNSDIRAYQIGMNFIFIPNGKKFSYNAAFNQTVLQKKSAGSFMLIPSLRFDEIKSQNLIPDSVKQYYGVINDLQRNRNYAFTIQAGYGFNLTKDFFYFSGAALIGSGIQTQTYSYPLGKFYKMSLPLVGRAKASLGYNGKIIFTGIFANADFCQSRIEQVRTQQTVYTYGVFLGFRAVEYTKTKGQLKAEAKRKKDAEREAAKKAKEEKRQAAIKSKENKKKTNEQNRKK